MPATTDGRLARGARTREAIITALVDLVAAGTLDPTFAEIAERAGVSERTVYHHFGDFESLAAAVARGQLDQHGHLAHPPAPTGDAVDRVRALVRQRAAYFEAITPLRRGAAVVAHRNATVERLLATQAQRFRTQVESLFAAELNALTTGDRRTLLDVLDVLACWETWERLRRVQGLDVAAAERVLEIGLAGALGTVAPAPTDA